MTLLYWSFGYKQLKNISIGQAMLMQAKIKEYIHLAPYDVKILMPRLFPCSLSIAFCNYYLDLGEVPKRFKMILAETYFKIYSSKHVILQLNYSDVSTILVEGREVTIKIDEDT